MRKFAATRALAGIFLTLTVVHCVGKEDALLRQCLARRPANADASMREEGELFRWNVSGYSYGGSESASTMNLRGGGLSPETPVAAFIPVRLRGSLSPK